MWLSDRAVRREFPVLETLSPPDLQRLVLQSRRAFPRWQRTTLVTWVAAGDAVLYASGLFFIVYFVAAATPRGSAGAVAGGFAVMAMVAAVPALVAVRSGREFERRALRERLARPFCSRCRYSLESLPAPGGCTRCPECGATQWIGPTDAPAAPEEVAYDAPRCLGCGYSLAGLPDHDGGGLCPECGREQGLPAAPFAESAP